MPKTKQSTLRKSDAEMAPTTNKRTIMNSKKDDTSADNTTTTAKKSHTTARINKSTAKTVNSNSRNRRKCQLLEDPSRDRTPERGNRTQHDHQHRTRVTIKITLPKADTLLPLFQQKSQELMQQMKTADENVAFLPWKAADDHKTYLTAEAAAPETISQYRLYFHRLYVPREYNEGVDKATLYFGAHIGHDATIDDIRKMIIDWLRDNDCGIYPRMIQCEESTEIGWFLWSTKSMDAGALADEIHDILGFAVGLKWKAIPTGARGKIPKNQIVRAIVVEVDTRQSLICQRKLLTFYGRNKKVVNEYPNGIRLRFVKLKKDCINTTEKSKVDKLRNRQQIFNNHIKTMDSWDIIAIDYAQANINEPTLRQMIMSINSRGTTTPLFHSVDLDWKGQGHTFQFSPSLQEEAECMGITLLSFLEHHYPKVNVAQHFTQDAIERNKGYNYDVKSEMVIDVTTKDMDEEYTDLLGFEINFDAIEEEELRPKHMTDTNGMPQDDDSVSTLGAPFSPSKSKRGNTARTSLSGTSDTISIGSSNSTITMESVVTLQSQMEVLQSRLDNQEKATQAGFDKLASLLIKSNRAGEGSHPSPIIENNDANGRNSVGQGL